MGVADEIAEELEPVLQGYAREFGLPADAAASLRLVWTGASYDVQSDQKLDTLEYGDGTGPAPRPIFKAMNRLHGDIEQRLEESLLERASTSVRPW